MRAIFGSNGSVVEECTSRDEDNWFLGAEAVVPGVPVWSLCGRIEPSDAVERSVFVNLDSVLDVAENRERMVVVFGALHAGCNPDCVHVECDAMDSEYR